MTPRPKQRKLSPAVIAALILLFPAAAAFSMAPQQTNVSYGERPYDAPSVWTGTQFIVFGGTLEKPNPPVIHETRHEIYHATFSGSNPNGLLAPVGCTDQIVTGGDSGGCLLTRDHPGNNPGGEAVGRAGMSAVWHSGPGCYGGASGCAYLFGGYMGIGTGLMPPGQIGGTATDGGFVTGYGPCDADILVWPRSDGTAGAFTWDTPDAQNFHYPFALSNPKLQGVDEIHHTSAVADPASGKAYIFGGSECMRTGGMAMEHIWEYDMTNPFNDAVMLTADSLPSPRSGTSAVWDPTITLDCPSGCAYVFGGVEPGGPGMAPALDDIVRFSPGHAPGSRVSTLPVTLSQPRSDTAAFWDGDEAFIIGGLDDAHIALTDIDAFQPDRYVGGTLVTSAQVTAQPPMPEKTHSGTASYAGTSNLACLSCGYHNQGHDGTFSTGDVWRIDTV